MSTWLPSRFAWLPLTPVALLVLCACAGSAGADKGSVRKRGLRLSESVSTVPREPSLLSGLVTQASIDGGEPRLAGDHAFDVYSLAGQAGDLVTVEMKSRSLDSYLVLSMPGEGKPQILDEDDDSGAKGQDARIQFGLPDDGTYWIHAAALGEGATGDYELTLSAEPLPDLPRDGDPTAAYALVIGISDYPGRSLDLDGAPLEDSRLFADLLVEQFGFARENILMLSDKEATRLRVTMALVDHLGQAGEEGLAVLYFSGHGFQLKENVHVQPPEDPETDGVDETLYLADGAPLIDDELFALLDRLPAGRMLAVLDACYSGGTATRSKLGIPKRVRLKDLEYGFRLPDVFLGSVLSKGEIQSASRTNQVVLAASAEKELSWVLTENPGRGEGPVSAFTYFLDEQLRSFHGGADFAELIDVVGKQTNRHVMKVARARQNPVLAGGAKARLVAEFLAPPAQ